MKAKNFFRASRGLIGATHLYALPPAAFHIRCPLPFINPVSAPGAGQHSNSDISTTGMVSVTNHRLYKSPPQLAEVGPLATGPWLQALTAVNTASPVSLQSSCSAGCTLGVLSRQPPHQATLCVHLLCHPSTPPISWMAVS